MKDRLLHEKSPPHKKIRKKMKEETRAKRLRVILKHLTFLWVFFFQMCQQEAKSCKGCILC